MKKIRTFKQAKENHASVKETAEALQKEGVADELANVWEVIAGRLREPTPGTFEWHVDVEMPLDLVATCRVHSEIATAYAYSACCAAYMKNQKDFAAAAREGWRYVMERKNLANNVEEGYGCDKGPSWETARELNGAPDVQKVEYIARMAGQMYKSMQGLRKAPSTDPHEVDGVEQGGEPERLLASELAQLVDPTLTDQAAIRILEKRAPQYKMRGDQKASRGPLVIALDESGSMHDDSECGRNTFAKAAAVALARIAHEGGRMVAIVHFGDSAVVSRCAPGDHKALLDMSRHFLSGGTDIALALTKAAEEVEGLRQEGHVGADIVIVTDGEDGNYPGIDKVLSYTQARGTRLWTVAIECVIPPQSPLNARASELIRVGGTKRADQVASLRAAAQAQVPAGAGGMLN